MPHRSPRDVPHTEGDIRDVVIRLARPDGDGGAVIERAAIVAEGATAAAIEDWVIAHGGEPEAPLITTRGLYAARTRRYVLPVAALD